MAVFCFSHTAKSEPFYWNAFDLKVKSQKVTPLLELLDETFTFSDKPFKVTLAEYVFSNDDRTHGLDLSSSNIDALSSVMDTDDIKTERDQFKKKFYDLVEIKSKYSGIRLITTNPPVEGVDKKKQNDYFAIWEMEVTEPKKYATAFTEMLSKTKNLRKQHTAGLGGYLFGRGKKTHYVLHSFSSYADLVKSLSAYEENTDFQQFMKLAKPLYTGVDNAVFKIVKQW